MQCVLPQGQTTPEKILSNPWYSKSFYEPNQYKCAIDRCEAGFKSCEIASEMFKSFVELQARHATDIRHWSTACLHQIRQSKEFGTHKKAWIKSIQAMELTANRHDALAGAVEKNVVEKMVTYKHDNYARSYLQIKVTKDFDKQFKAAQKGWIKALHELDQAKQAYEECKRKLKEANLSQNYVRSNDGSTDEEKEQVQRAVDKRKKDADQHKCKYEHRREDLEEKRPAYEKSMTDILDRMHDFECKRGNHFKVMLIALQDAFDKHTDGNAAEISEAFQDAITSHNIEADVKYWNKNYGSDTKVLLSLSDNAK